MSIETTLEFGTPPKLSFGEKRESASQPVPLVPYAPPSDERIAQIMEFVKTPVEIAPYLPEDLHESDGEFVKPLWHMLEFSLLLNSTINVFKEREDYYVGGNMFIYYNQRQDGNVDYCVPDFFFISRGISRSPMRPYWTVWEENGGFPDVIIELVSAQTRKVDLNVKKTIYEETFKTREYFCCDPLTNELLGWRLTSGRYQSIDFDVDGRLRCEELDMTLGFWHGQFGGYEGIWLRFFDSHGNVVLTPGETAEQRAQAAERRLVEAEERAKVAKKRAERAEILNWARKERAEVEKIRADALIDRAYAERRRANSARNRAEDEKLRADQLAVELAELKARVKLL